MPLEMEYFILRPRSKRRYDIFAQASRLAMLTYASCIRGVDEQLAMDLEYWVRDEKSLAYKTWPPIGVSIEEDPCLK